MKPTSPTVQRLLDLQNLIVALAGVDRKVFLPPQATVPENDVEHSYSLAMLCWYMAPQFPHLDLGKLLQLCLAHDLVEAYCGDTFSFDSDAVSSQKDREVAALVQLKTEWADFPALAKAIDEYEARQTPEAKFVVTMDRFHPMLMDYLGGGRTWQNLGITFEKLMAIKDDDLTPSEVAEYYAQFKQLLVQNQHLFPKE